MENLEIFILNVYETYEGMSKSFRTESIKKYTLNFGITC
jgi:hypothetical protein